MVNGKKRAQGAIKAEGVTVEAQFLTITRRLKVEADKNGGEIRNSTLREKTYP